MLLYRLCWSLLIILISGGKTKQQKTEHRRTATDSSYGERSQVSDWLCFDCVSHLHMDHEYYNIIKKSRCLSVCLSVCVNAMNDLAHNPLNLLR